MFKYIFQLIILSGLCSAQAFEVQNVTASQRTDGSHIVDVCYDLSPDDLFASLMIIPNLSIDGGETWINKFYFYLYFFYYLAFFFLFHQRPQ